MTLGQAGAQTSASSAPPPAPVRAAGPAAPVTGFAQFPFGTPLRNVQARLERSFPGLSSTCERGFGRTSLRLREGLTLNGNSASALFTFVGGTLAAVTLELDANAATARQTRTYLGQRFGAARRSDPIARAAALGRTPLEDFAGGSVRLEDRVAHPLGAYLAVHFQDRRVMDGVEARIERAADPKALRAIFEEGGWKTLPREPLGKTEEFLRALSVADTFEQIALLNERPTRERAWAGASFYLDLVTQTEGEARQREVLRITGTELMNPLSLFLLGRIAYTEAALSGDRSPEAAARAEQGYLQMMNAYMLASLLQEVTPQMTALLVGTHTAMISGLAVGSADLSAKDRERVDASWGAFLAAFERTYRVKLPR